MTLDEQLEIVKELMGDLVAAFSKFHDRWSQEQEGDSLNIIPILQNLEDAVAEIETTANNLRNELAHTLGMCCLVMADKESDMRASQEMLHTIFHELVNADWKFDGQEVREFNIDELAGKIRCHLANGKMLEIRVSEQPSPKEQVCQNCGELKGGWPDEWRNIGGKGLVYACADCVDRHSKGE